MPARPLQNADGVGGAANDVLIVGQDGRAMQFDGTTWSIVASPVPFDLYDVWGYAENRAFVVGQNGTILF